jgi:ABC-type multidrug transport system ATPase subunit/CRP-like cAMP-binding protein
MSQMTGMPPQPPSGVRGGTSGDGALWGEYGRRVSFLRRVGLFHDASPTLLAHVAAALRPLRAEPGMVICREGEIGDQFFLIDTGTLTVTIEAGGRNAELAQLGPGEFFGELALLRGGAQQEMGRRTGTVTARTAAQLWSLGTADFRELLAREPQIAAIVQRAAQLRERANSSSAFEVERRNLAVLAQGRQRITLGRDQTNDLAFPSRLVSRNHAVVEWSGETYTIRDLDSSNGTFVNGQRVAQAVLRDGDEIWVADERFIFDRQQIHHPTDRRGIRVDVQGLTKTVRGGKAILNDVSLSIMPGEFVAIVGGSGAGKTTLMDAISGVRPATGGTVLYNGRDYYASMALYRNILGYVPQDDIIHTALPVRDTLRYAAQMRLPPDTSRADVDAAVDQTLAELGMTPHANTLVGALSGGQRKRASIGVELLTRPRIFFLDEPTSGLDPATDAQMMRLMRQLADGGSTVLLTTHATKNVVLCDKVIFLARGGFLAFIGTPQRALQYFAAEAFDEIYERLGNEATPEEWAARFRNSPDYAQMLAEQARLGPAQAGSDAGQHQSLGATGNTGGIRRQLRQFSVLSRRATQIFTQNRGQLIPLVMQPIVISILVLILFRANAFDLDAENPAATVPLLFLLAFAALLFGIFNGIQEIVKEAAIFRRERMINLAIMPYVLSKIAILSPIIIYSELVMIAILLVFGRLPDFSLAVYIPLTVTLMLTAFTALLLGLCGSAAISTTSQASQIMPVLIMPQAIFAGAILAVPAMNIVGRSLSALVFMRWSFEALGRSVDLDNLFANGTSPIARASGVQFGDSFSRNVTHNWLFLAIFLVFFFVVTCVTLWRKSA